MAVSLTTAGTVRETFHYRAGSEDCSQLHGWAAHLVLALKGRMLGLMVCILPQPVPHVCARVYVCLSVILCLSLSPFLLPSPLLFLLLLPLSLFLSLYIDWVIGPHCVARLASSSGATCPSCLQEGGITGMSYQLPSLALFLPPGGSTYLFFTKGHGNCVDQSC